MRKGKFLTWDIAYVLEETQGNNNSNAQTQGLNKREVLSRDSSVLITN